MNEYQRIFVDDAGFLEANDMAEKELLCLLQIPAYVFLTMQIVETKYMRVRAFACIWRSEYSFDRHRRGVCTVGFVLLLVDLAIVQKVRVLTRNSPGRDNRHISTLTSYLTALCICICILSHHEDVYAIQMLEADCMPYYFTQRKYMSMIMMTGSLHRSPMSPNYSQSYG